MEVTLDLVTIIKFDSMSMLHAKKRDSPKVDVSFLFSAMICLKVQFGLGITNE